MGTAWNTGEFWEERCIGTQYETLSLEALKAASLRNDVSSEMASLWPICDAVPEPEEFWCEFTTWRRRAGIASRGITRQEYALAWEFIGDCRLAAARVAIELEAEDAPTHGKNIRVNRSDPKARGGSGRASSTSPVGRNRQKQQPHQQLISVARLCQEQHVLVPSNKEALRKAAQAVLSLTAGASTSKTSLSSKSSPSSSSSSSSFHHNNLPRGEMASEFPMPSSVATALLTWEILPRAVACLRHGVPPSPNSGSIRRERSHYSAAELVSIRGTVNRMLIPLLRAAERVFDRVPPSRSELEREWKEAAAATTTSKSGAAAGSCSDYLEVENMISGEPLPTTKRGGAVFFAGNDDASVNAAMSNPLKWLQHSMRILLEGGRRTYEEIVGELLCGGGGGGGGGGGDSESRGTSFPGILRSPLALHSDSDYLGKLPPPILFHTLTGKGAFSPRDTTTEASTFLLFTFAWDALHVLAVNHSRVASQSRPTPPQTLPSFLPAILHLTPRILAHPSLRVPIPAVPSALIPSDSSSSHTQSAKLPQWGFSPMDDPECATWKELAEPD